MPAESVFRFAPSPNGALHLGHAYSALVTYDMARAAGGRFLLRIEDIDPTRCRPEFEQAIYDDLAWLGLEWEEPVRRQSEHFNDYREALDRLEAQGLLYPCFASRKEIAEAVAALGQHHPRDPEGAPLYPGLWKGRRPEEIARRKADGEPFALRLDMEKALATTKRLHPAPLTFTELDGDGGRRTLEVEPALWGDAVIARKEAPTSYHLSVVVDDALQGVTHVTRGMDLFKATGIQRLLQVLLGLPEPLYHHHALVVDADGRKLSKSRGDTALAALREKGLTPAQVRALAQRNLEP